MINLLGVIFGIVISLLWIFLPLRRVPEYIRLKKRTYIISIVVGATLCTIVIIIMKNIWWKVACIPDRTPHSLLQLAAYAFICKALLEEGAKYFFVRCALKKHQPQGRLQYMLLAATIGVGYGIMGKLVSGDVVSMLFNAVLALHIMFQLVMGWYLYEAANTEDVSKKRSHSVKAFLVPFALHGIWEIFQGGAFLYFDSTNDFYLAMEVIATIIAAVYAVVVAIVCEVLMALYLKRV